MSICVIRPRIINSNYINNIVYSLHRLHLNDVQFIKLITLNIVVSCHFERVQTLSYA